MSCNIDSERYKEGSAWMTALDIVDLHDEYEDELPECTFLAEHYDEAMRLVKAGKPKSKVVLKNFWWYGERSGTSYEDVLRPHVMAKVHGNGYVRFIWEGGEWETRMKLGDPKELKVSLDP